MGSLYVRDSLENSSDCGKLQGACPKGVKEGVGKVLSDRVASP